MSDEKTTIQIQMTDDDFELLPIGSMHWAGLDWEKQEWRFVSLREPGVPIAWEFRYAYWFDSMASVMLARSFLEAKEFAYQILSDETGGEFVIITDFPANWESKEV